MMMTPLRLVALIAFAVTFAVHQAVAQEPPRPLASAMSALRGGDWDTALALAARDGPVARDVIEWQRLRASRGTFADVQDFLARNPDWPGLKLLRKRSEGVVADGSDAQVLAFFAAQLPQTGAGALAHARALKADGKAAAASDTVVLAWRSFTLSPEEQEAMLAAYGDTLAEHHVARLDMLLWDGDSAGARRMLPLVDEGWRKLAEARLALRADADGLDAAIEAVPAALKGHAGLAFERFFWRARKGQENAIDLLLSQSTSASALGEPEKWADRRRSLSRQEMRAGRLSRAYDMASSHFLNKGSAYADLEWLSGYLSLRLNKPSRALKHFRNFREAVDTPISLGRAGYWIGRTHEALGQPEQAAKAYAFGAEHQTSFYGLLAAERGGLPFDETLRGTETFPPWRDSSMLRSSVVQAGILCIAAGELYLAERMFVHYAETLNRTEIGQLSQMASDLGAPHLAVMVGKQGARQGMVVPSAYFALHPLTLMDLPVPHELALAIARRESEFDPGVISPVGARGLMQLMPRTAEEMAGKLDLAYDAQALLTDWPYNAQLGSGYLAELDAEFRGNLILMAAAYNAGPSRPQRWMELFGDPTRRGVDMIDWIEGIPFRETRNYVMRVAESVVVYRARLGLDPLPEPFSRMIKTAR